jgi:formamidopyrimidine-DNA glycosylase
MAELPEIIILSRQMGEHLAGLKLESLLLGQPKCLNARPEEFESALVGRRLDSLGHHGKWLILGFAPPGPNLLIHPGMGMDLLALGVEPKMKQAQKPQFLFFFEGEQGFSLRFWWFGRLWLAEPGQERAAAGRAGPAPLTPEFTPELLSRLMNDRPRMSLKSFLTDQKIVAGIGNVYVQDICFAIQAHPLTRLKDLREGQRARLHAAIEEALESALKRGINGFEMDFWGRSGQWGVELFQIGYKAGQPCPVCGERIEKIKAGSSASYICPSCQRLPE